MSANCLFCKIADGAIPAQKVFENEYIFGFVDIHPQAKIHLLFVHKKHTENINEMSGDPDSIAQMFQGIAEYTNANQLLSKEGFRIVSNQGPNAGQTVFHTHFHLLGGEALGRLGH